MVTESLWPRGIRPVLLYFLCLTQLIALALASDQQAGDRPGWWPGIRQERRIMGW